MLCLRTRRTLHASPTSRNLPCCCFFIFVFHIASLPLSADMTPPVSCWAGQAHTLQTCSRRPMAWGGGR